MSRVVRREYHRKGTRLYGAFCYQDNGKHFYVAFRKIKEIYRDKQTTISEALRQGTAGWAIDVETLLMAQSRDCEFLVIKDRKSGSVWTTRLENYQVPGRAQTLDWSRKGSTMQKCLSLTYFHHRPGEVSL